MPEFLYKAKTQGGKVVTGKISSSSQKSAKNDLFNRGLHPYVIQALANDKQTVSSKRGFIYTDEKGKLQVQLGSQLPSLKELAVFSKQFSLMIENGIPLMQCLKLLSQQQKKPHFKEVIEAIADSVEKGSSLSDALEPHRKIFDELYVSLIRAGEASGHLDKILRQLVTYIEKSSKIKSQIKSAMMYPAIIVLVAAGVITLLLVVVVPAFAKQFAGSGKPLPELTQLVVTMSDSLTHNYVQIIFCIFLLVVSIRMYSRSPKGRILIDKNILKLPLLGDVLLKIAISRFCSTMSTMLSSGVTILEALSICASSSGNKTIEGMVYKIREEISKGKTFHQPMTDSQMFPLMVCSMVAVGEQTGTLDETLQKISDIYDDEVDTAIDAMTSMIEPLLIVVIGAIVGFIVIAMYLPIFDLAGTVGD